MKLIKLTVLVLLASTQYINAQTNAERVCNLFSSVLDFSEAKLNDERPIANLNQLAAKQADTLFIFNKNNASSIFNLAKKYEYAIISVERHTVVLVDSWSNSTKSGYWGFRMPHGTGFIQKNNLMTKEEDYVNNIIGVPNGQRRTIFLFNKK